MSPAERQRLARLAAEQVRNWPPLSGDQRARLAALLRRSREVHRAC